MYDSTTAYYTVARDYVLTQGGIYPFRGPSVVGWTEASNSNDSNLDPD